MDSGVMTYGGQPVRTLDQATDEDLLERTLHGEEPAFQALYQRHLATIFRFAYRMLGSSEHAEDVAHDCFLGLIRNPKRFDPRRGSLRTYLYMAVRNMVYKRLRRSDLEQPVDEQVDKIPASGANEPLPRLLAQELRHEVRMSIGKMPPLQREVLVLFEYEDQSLAQIADITGTDIGAIKARLHRARERLRRDMAGYVNDGSRKQREHLNHD